MFHRSTGISVPEEPLRPAVLPVRIRAGMGINSPISCSSDCRRCACTEHVHSLHKATYLSTATCDVSGRDRDRIRMLNVWPGMCVGLLCSRHQHAMCCKSTKAWGRKARSLSQRLQLASGCTGPSVVAQIALET
jgi:hypothetical protein